MKVELCFINFLDSFTPKLVCDYFYNVLLVLLFPSRQNILQALNSKFLKKINEALNIVK
jgi:hypothetical protein